MNIILKLFCLDYRPKWKHGGICNVFKYEKDMGNALQSLCALSVYMVNDLNSTGIRPNFVIKLAIHW